MKEIGTRVDNYTEQLKNTLNGYLKSIETEKDVDKVKKFKSHVQHINDIISFGVQDYLALDLLPTINYYAENYSSIIRNDSLNTPYLHSFGIENQEEMEMLLNGASSVDDIRNIIWHECFGMSYDLLPKWEVSSTIETLQNNPNINSEEKKEKISELICQSGYSINGYSNPTHIDGGLDYINSIVNNIKSKGKKII